MHRRTFLAQSFALSLLTRHDALFAAGQENLLGHKLASVETRRLPLLWPRHVGKNAKLDNHGHGPTVNVAILKTDQGAVGWGQTSGDIRRMDQLVSEIKGQPIADLIDPASGVRKRDYRLIDVALHDLAGVILQKPVWQMLSGAAESLIHPIYSGMIYFDELGAPSPKEGIDIVLKNCAADRDMGYRQLKVKIGRGNKWMPVEEGLKRDVEIVREIARAFPDCALLVDGNDGYTADSFIRFLKGIEGIPLVWIEEPFVENEAAWKQVYDWTRANGREKTLLADGEQHNDFPLLEKLEAAGILQVRLTDILGHGFTPWREWMPRLKATKTLCSPHCWGSGLSTIYTGHLVGALGNCPTIEGVSCSDEHVDFGDNVVRDGKLQLSRQPGFGLKLRS